MSLKVWLPLDGDTKNYGTVQDTINWTTAATYNNNGKMGKALATGGATMPAAMTAKVLNNNAVTIACWIYVNADAGDSTNRAMIFGNSSMNSLGGRQFSIFRYPNADDIHLSWQSYNGSSYTQVLTFVQSGVLTARAWNHVCLTYQNPTATLYVNGVKINSWSAVMNASSFAYNTNLIWNSTSHYINDFRIYDNCLSTKEVKELSQCLVGHWKLDNITGGNLVSSAGVVLTATATGTDVSPSTQLGYSAITAAIPSLIGKQISMSLDIDLVNAVNTTGITNHRVGAEVFIKYTDNTTSWFGIWVNLDSTPKTSSKRYTNTITIPSGKTFSSIGACGMYIQHLTSGTATLSNLKVEAGDGNYVWSPSSSEAGKTCCANSAGYKNDMVVSGLISNVPSPKYNSAINTPSGTFLYSDKSVINSLPKDALTVNAWVNITSISNSFLSCTEGGGWDFETTDGSLCFWIYLSGVGYSSANSGITTQSLVGSWHMITGTFDGTYVKIYIDGILRATSNAVGTIGYNAYNSLIIGGEASGSLHGCADSASVVSASDVRIYGTALSANDILELYQTPINIDDKGNLHSLSVDEDASISACSNGSFISACHNELLIEPDGAIFEHIFHHNNPSANLFASTDTFTTGVYKNEHTWANFQVFNDLTSWELLVIQTQTTASAADKWRWIQTVNPNVAAFGDVDAADITKVSGYSTWNANYGGLCIGNSGNTRYTQNNGTNGNWWGATGAWTAYQGGIPGYMGKLVTTGCIDLYVKIGDTKSSLYRNQVDTFNTIIEK